MGRHLSTTDEFASVSFLYPTLPYMLQPLQVPTAAVQPHEPKQQPPVLQLPMGSTVYAQLSPNSLYERAELLSAQPGRLQAVVALHSTGAQHQVAADRLTQSVMTQQHEDDSGGDSGTARGHSQSEASGSDDNEEETDADEAPAVRGHVASAVWDADEAAMQV